MTSKGVVTSRDNAVAPFATRSLCNRLSALHDMSGNPMSGNPMALFYIKHLNVFGRLVYKLLI
jgi:hypothetical protein